MGSSVDYRNGSAHVGLSGDLTIAESSTLYELFRSLARSSGAKLVELDLSRLGSLDSAGAVTVLLGQKLLEQAGKRMQLLHANDEHCAVLRSIAEPERPAAPPVAGTESLLERVGEAGLETGSVLREFSSVVFRAFHGMGDLVRGKHRTRLAALIEQSAIMGADAVPIVALMGALIGVVLAFQAAYQLEQFGAELFMAEVVSIGMVREFGAVITSVILSGRSGAAMAAELGTMAVNEELDALRSMGIDPARYLVSPRLLAMTLVTPLLGVVATAAGIAGGLGIAGLLGVPPRTVYQRMTESLVADDFVLGLVKSLLFGWIITLVGCFMGLRTRGGAHNVGRNTTRAVVAQIMLIVITDSVVTTTWTLVHGHV